MNHSEITRKDYSLSHPLPLPPKQEPVIIHFNYLTVFLKHTKSHNSEPHPDILLVSIA